MTVAEAALSGDRRLRTTKILSDVGAADDDKSYNEPGSPIFHSAIRFQNQKQLNEMETMRERRGGLRRLASELQEDEGGLFDALLDGP